MSACLLDEIITFYTEDKLRLYSVSGLNINRLKHGLKQKHSKLNYKTAV